MVDQSNNRQKFIPQVNHLNIALYLTPNSDANTGLFGYWTALNRLNNASFCYSDPYCIALVFSGWTWHPAPAPQFSSLSTSSNATHYATATATTAATTAAAPLILFRSARTAKVIKLFSKQCSVQWGIFPLCKLSQIVSKYFVFVHKIYNLWVD